MKRWIFVAASCLIFLALKQAGAASPDDVVAGTYYARSPGALLAFRIDPWTEGVHAVRGLGRGTFGAENDERDLIFEIRGTYRPSAAHTAQGVFLFRDGDVIQQVPWKAMYDRRERTFQWAMIVDGELHALQKAGPPTTEDLAAVEMRKQATNAAPTTDAASANSSTSSGTAAASSSAPSTPDVTSPFLKSNAAGSDSTTTEASTSAAPTTALFQRTPYLSDVVDAEGNLDFGKVIIRAVDQVPVSKPAIKTEAKPTAKPDKAATPWERQPGVIDMVIIDTLTNTEVFGSKNAELADILKRRLDHDLGISPMPKGNVRKRGENPPLAPTTSTTPTAPPIEAPPVDAPPKPGTEKSPAPRVKTVPNVVGLSVDNGVGELWAAGLNPTTIECLGQSTDPDKADRIVTQIPAAGSPYPPDGVMTLHWYSKPTGASVLNPGRPVDEGTTTSAPVPNAPSAGGFQPGDGKKVEAQFAAGEIRADGKGIDFGAKVGDGFVTWGIYQFDEASFQPGIASFRSSVQKIMNETVGSDGMQIDVAQKTAGVNMVFEYSTRFNNGAGYTNVYQCREYRGFFLFYSSMTTTAGQPLGAAAAAALEKSEQLIDLRFPK